MLCACSSAAVSAAAMHSAGVAILWVPSLINCTQPLFVASDLLSHTYECCRCCYCSSARRPNELIGRSHLVYVIVIIFYNRYDQITIVYNRYHLYNCYQILKSLSYLTIAIIITIIINLLQSLASLTILRV